MLVQVALSFLLVRGTDKNSFISLLLLSLQRDDGRTDKNENRWRLSSHAGVFFFCFPTGRWEVSGKLAKKVWAYIEKLHVYLLFQICNGKKIVNIYWNRYFLKGRKKSFMAKTCVERKNFYKFSTTSRQKPVIICSGLGCSNGKKKTPKKQCWGRSGALALATMQCSEHKTTGQSQKSQSKLKDGGKPREVQSTIKLGK